MGDRLYLSVLAAAMLAVGSTAATAQKTPGVTDSEIKIGNIMPYSGAGVGV
jgi:hypothetical protein